MKNQATILLSPEAAEVYDYLKENAAGSKTERMLLKAIHGKADIIKTNTHYGESVAKHLIPEEYISKYNAANLFRVELPAFWRMLYTLKKDESEVEIIAFVLDIIDHKKYNKKFNYRSR